MAQNPKKAPPKRLIGARNEKAQITTKKTKHPPAKKQIPHTRTNRPSTPTQNDTNARKRKSPRKRHQNHPPGVVLDPKPPAHAKQRSQTQKRTQNRHKNAQKGTKSPKVTQSDTSPKSHSGTQTDPKVESRQDQNASKRSCDCFRDESP